MVSFIPYKRLILPLFPRILWQIDVFLMPASDSAFLTVICLLIIVLSSLEICCSLRPFLVAETKYPTPSTQRKGSLCLADSEVVGPTHSQPAPNKKWPGGRAWQHKAVHTMASRKRRENRGGWEGDLPFRSLPLTACSQIPLWTAPQLLNPSVDEPNYQYSTPRIHSPLHKPHLWTYAPPGARSRSKP